MVPSAAAAATMARIATSASAFCASASSGASALPAGGGASAAGPLGRRLTGLSGLPVLIGLVGEAADQRETAERGGPGRHRPARLRAEHESTQRAGREPGDETGLVLLEEGLALIDGALHALAGLDRAEALIEQLARLTHHVLALRGAAGLGGVAERVLHLLGAPAPRKRSRRLLASNMAVSVVARGPCRAPVTEP